MSLERSRGLGHANQDGISLYLFVNSSLNTVRGYCTSKESLLNTRINEIVSKHEIMSICDSTVREKRLSLSKIPKTMKGLTFFYYSGNVDAECTVHSKMLRYLLV